MKASELRIGNYVKCKRSNDAGIYQVLAIDGWNLKVMLDGVRRGEWLNDSFHKKPEIKPIPLTEEWLLKFGFEKDSLHGLARSFGLFRVSYASNTFYWWDGIDWSITLDDRIKYVHQLQNLYFALTGEELTIKKHESVS